MIYLNQAATSYPKPRCVPNAHARALASVPTGQFSGTRPAAERDIIDHCRGELGQLLGIQETERIFFSAGAAAAANAVLYGLGFKRAHVVTTATEHSSILRPLFNLKTFFAAVSVVPCDRNGFVEPEQIAAAITPETRVIIVNHCSHVTGMIQDIQTIAALARSRRLLCIVDVSQSAGCIPVRTDEWGVDAVIFTGHKSLFGPLGVGGYYVRRRLTFRPDRDAAGTQKRPEIAALTAGLVYLRGQGIGRIQAREIRLMRQLYESLEDNGRFVLYGRKERNLGPVFGFNIHGLPPYETAARLQADYGIIVQAGRQYAPLIHQYLQAPAAGVVRVSISALTAAEEIMTLMEVLHKLAADAA